MITVGLILLALANLYIVARFIRWIRDLPPEQLDETTAMVIREQNYTLEHIDPRKLDTSALDKRPYYNKVFKIGKM